MCFFEEIPEKKRQKNKFALDEEDLQVEPELEQVQASSDLNKLTKSSFFAVSSEYQQ